MLLDSDPTIRLFEESLSGCAGLGCSVCGGNPLKSSQGKMSKQIILALFLLSFSSLWHTTLSSYFDW